MHKQIVLATHNRHKIEELRAIFAQFSVEILTLDNFPGMPKVEETGKTLTENALLKALDVHIFCNMSAISDDTGLEVDALDGAPGVFSARFAGENATYTDNVDLLLKKMKNVKQQNRSARFRTIMAYVDKNIKLTAEGEITGMIMEKKCGSAGFGYDPVFYSSEACKTFAEMSRKEKNKISHRSHATRKMIHLLQSKQIIPQIKKETPITN